MRLVPWFVALLVLTLILLGAAIYAGRSARRRLHLQLVPLALGSLVATILLAIKIGHHVTFDPLRLAVHTELARLATTTLVGTVLTGLVRIRRDGPRKRLLHLIAVWVGVTCLVAALVSGTWMFASARPVAGQLFPRDPQTLAETGIQVSLGTPKAQSGPFFDVVDQPTIH